MFFVHLRDLSFIWPFREANTRTSGNTSHGGMIDYVSYDHSLSRLNLAVYADIFYIEKLHLPHEMDIICLTKWPTLVSSYRQLVCNHGIDSILILNC